MKIAIQNYAFLMYNIDYHPSVAFSPRLVLLLCLLEKMGARD